MCAFHRHWFGELPGWMCGYGRHRRWWWVTNRAGDMSIVTVRPRMDVPRGTSILKLLGSGINIGYLCYPSPKHPVVDVVIWGTTQTPTPPRPSAPSSPLWVWADGDSWRLPLSKDLPSADRTRFAPWSLHGHPQKEAHSHDRHCTCYLVSPVLCLFSHPLRPPLPLPYPRHHLLQRTF